MLIASLLKAAVLNCHSAVAVWTFAVWYDAEVMVANAISEFPQDQTAYKVTIVY